MPRSEVYNCDCLEFMLGQINRAFDLAIVDPPYWSPDEQTGRLRTSGNVQATLDFGKKWGGGAK